MARSMLTGSAEAIKELRKYESELFKQFRKDLTSQLSPIIKPIQGQINSQVTNELKAEMPGMFHNGRSSWSGVNISTRVSTKPKELIYINAAGRLGKVGFNYAELAGIQRRKPRPISREYVKNGRTMRHRVNGQGLEFNDKLNRTFGKTGRFAFIRVVKQTPAVERKVLFVTEKYNLKVNRRLGS